MVSQVATLLLRNIQTIRHQKLNLFCNIISPIACLFFIWVVKTIVKEEITKTRFSIKLDIPTQNITNAKKEGLLVGLYFFSYANTPKKVKEQVNYIMKKLNGRHLDLPIAFDWENWSRFNTYNVS